MLGCVSVTALNNPMATKAPPCSQEPRRRAGHLRPRLQPPLREGRLLPCGPSSARRCSHSPGLGSGQMLHQDRPPSGMKKSFNAVHHAIHTKMIAKLAPPTGVPSNPARMVKINPASVTICARSCSQRPRSTVRINGTRAASHRFMRVSIQDQTSRQAGSVPQLSIRQHSRLHLIFRS